MSSAPDLGAANKGEGGEKAALRKEKDALVSSSASREDIMATPDFPPVAVTATNHRCSRFRPFTQLSLYRAYGTWFSTPGPVAWSV